MEIEKSHPSQKNKIGFMKLSKDQVRHVATLARLELKDEEEERFSVQLSAILDYINQLSEIDTDGVSPTSRALEVNNVFREDEVKVRFDEESWRSNAPSEDKDHLRVPKIIED